MTLAGQSYTDEQLHGLACIRCGKCGGAMVVAGNGPRGQLFQHPAIKPGIYDCGDTVSIAVAEVCAHFGVPVTPENIATVEQATRAAVAETYPGVDVPIEVIG